MGGPTTNVNGQSLVHKGSGGCSTSTVPDVCLTPSGPVPVAYTNVAYSADLVKGTTTVFADGGNMCANNGSEFATSIGDEPGTAGGVTSGTNMAEATWTLYSPNVKLEGAEACRLGDLMSHNHANTMNTAGEVQKPLPGMTFDDKGECPEGGGGDVDGQYVGSDGAGGCSASKTAKDPSDVSPVMPSSGTANGTIVYVNGINTDPCKHCKTLHTLADHNCAAVVGIYNNSGAGEYLQDKFGKGDWKATNTLKDLLNDRAKSGEPIHLVAHSHGGLVTADALSEVKNGLGSLPSNFRIDTFGAASYTYPTGPKYLHTINNLDIVPSFLGKGILNKILPFGLGHLVTALDPEIKQIYSWKTFLGHSVDEDYIPTSKPAYCK